MHTKYTFQLIIKMIFYLQGSGKGTQSSRLEKNFGVAHLSSGDLLRRNITDQTALGQQASQYVADGKLVPDNLLISLIDNELFQVGNTVSLAYYQVLTHQITNI